jgi:hypothetical protein
LLPCLEAARLFRFSWGIVATSVDFVLKWGKINLEEGYIELEPKVFHSYSNMINGLCFHI